jgi:predicted metal-dependent phosphoesterase TrpH
MKFDLHCHSTASDGKLSPHQVLALAAMHQVELFALTDHDTIAGFREVETVDWPFRLVSGIEFSTVWNGVSVHVIGLDFDPDAPSMQEGVAFQREVRKKRAQVIDQRLAKQGMADTLQGALKYCPDECQVGRPHFAQHLQERGFVATTAEAFDRWLGSGRIGDVKSGWPELPQAIGWIRQAGGVAVLAHPLHYRLTFSRLRQLVAFFQESGGAAVEICGEQANPDQKRNLAELVRKSGLAASGGSDFHDPEWAWSKIGQVEAMPAQQVPVWSLFQRTRITPP